MKRADLIFPLRGKTVAQRPVGGQRGCDHASPGLVREWLAMKFGFKHACGQKLSVKPFRRAAAWANPTALISKGRAP